MGQGFQICGPCVATDVETVAFHIYALEGSIGSAGKANCDLLLASKAGDIVGIKKAMEAGADINARLPLRSHVQNTEDHDCAQLKVTNSGHRRQRPRAHTAPPAPAMPAMLFATATPNTTDWVSMETRSQNLTPLMHAAWEGHIEAVNLLLSMDANPDLQTADGMQALHLAAHSASDDCFQALLQSGANPLAKDNLGRDALQCVPFVKISHRSADRKWLTLLKEASGMAALVATLLLADEQEFQPEVGVAIASVATVHGDEKSEATPELSEEQSEAWSVEPEGGIVHVTVPLLFLQPEQVKRPWQL